MKRVFLFLVVVFGLFATMTSYAADTMNWNQLQVGATYNKSTQELKVEFLHSGATYTPSNTYTSRLILTGFDRTQSLVFNPVKNVLQTQYVYITSPMKSIYQYIYSVTDTSTNKIVSSYSGSISFTGSTNSNILISITNFSNTPSTSTGTVVTQTGSIVTQTGSINASYNDQQDAQTIYSIVMADMQKKPYSTL